MRWASRSFFDCFLINFIGSMSRIRAITIVVRAKSASESVYDFYIFFTIYYIYIFLKYMIHVETRYTELGHSGA